MRCDREVILISRVTAAVRTSQNNCNKSAEAGDDYLTCLVFIVTITGIRYYFEIRVAAVITRPMSGQNI